MNPAAAAARLVAARRAGVGLAGLEPALVAESAADAYAVQDETLRALGAAIAGWKVGAPNATADPVAAPLLAALVLPSPARFPVTQESFRGVEAELALRLGRDLPARGRAWSDDEAWEAVAAIHVAIELLQSRYADRRAMPAPALLADMQSNGGFTYGASAAPGAIDFASVRASIAIGSKEDKTAVGGNPAGHPKRLLGWLANHAASRGRALRAGDFVTTGSHTGITVAPVGARVVARFDGVGEAMLELPAA